MLVVNLACQYWPRLGRLAVMNPLAQDLNLALSGTVAYRLFSELGRQIYFPRGIVAQSAEAGARAFLLNATIGMAVENGEPIVLPVVGEQVPGLTRKQLVSYAPTSGYLPLRKAWKAQMLKKNPSLADGTFSLPMVVPGLTNGVFQATELFIETDTVVLVPDLHWDNYPLIMGVRREARLVNFPFFDETSGFNVEGLKRALSENAITGKIVLCLNFPNNPSGYSPTKVEARQIVQVLVEQAEAGTDILVLCDDAYFGLAYENDTCRESLFAFLAAAHERILAVKVDGTTKEDFSWSFRVGFVTFGFKGATHEHFHALTQKLMGAIRASVSSSSGLAQQILLKAWEKPGYEAEKQAAFQDLERKYRKVREIVQAYEASGRGDVLSALPFNSGYFMSFRTRGVSAETLRLALLDKGIGTIAISETILRVAYSSVDYDRLAELFDYIYITAAESCVVCREA